MTLPPAPDRQKNGKNDRNDILSAHDDHFASRLYADKRRRPPSGRHTPPEGRRRATPWLWDGVGMRGRNARVAQTPLAK